MQGTLVAFRLGVVLALASTATAQSPLLSVPGQAPGDRFGGALALLPDVDGDGRAEIVVGSPFAASGYGDVRLVSGLDASLRWQASGPAIGSRFGAALCSLGDIDGDGLSEVAVGAPFANAPARPGAGLVRVLSGANGAVLFEVWGDSAADHFGWAVAGPGDVDGDGLPDVAIGSIDDDNAGPSSGMVRVVSGAGGATLVSRNGASPQELLGMALSVVRDLDGDGRNEIVAGAPSFGGSALIGRARVLSGATLAPLMEWTGIAMGDTFGGAVAGLGDIDGDGVDDVLVGARQPTAGVFGFARAFSGASGAQLYEFLGDAQHNRWGTAVAGAGDVDGDGRGDLLVGSPEASFAGSRAGSVQLYSGADGSLMWEQTGPALSQLGSAIAGGLDLSGDGHPDVAIGSPFDSTAAASAGMVLALRGSDNPIDPPEPPDPGEEPRMLTVDREVVSLAARDVQQLTLDAGAEHGGRRYLFLGSMSGTEPGFDLFDAHVPLVVDRYTRYSLWCWRGPLAHGRGRLDDLGGAQATFRPPRGLSQHWIGREFHHAALVLGGRRKPILASNAVSVTIAP